jgi:hypothetical protein
MTEITTRQEYIDQACNVYGEKWREILFKKWTYYNNIDMDDCSVYLIIERGPGIYENHLYDTEEEATIELRKVLEERCRKILERKDWKTYQPYTNMGWRWIYGLKE